MYRTQFKIDKIWLEILMILGIIFASLIMFPVNAQLSDPLNREKQQTWEFGENLVPSDSFSFHICDVILRMPKSPTPCYDLRLELVSLIPDPTGEKWIASAQIDHLGLDKKSVHTNMIWHIDATTYQVETDGSTLEYARSFERTIGWINQYASSHSPQILTIGKSWGMISSDTEETELLVNHQDSITIGNEEFETYNIGFSLIKESSIQIKDDFPFPIKAVIYKPISSHQNIPLAFSFEIQEYYKSNNMCKFDIIPDMSFNSPLLQNMSKIIEGSRISETKFNELLDDDSDDEFDVSSADVSSIEESESTNSTESAPDLNTNSTNFDETEDNNADEDSVEESENFYEFEEIQEGEDEIQDSSYQQNNEQIFSVFQKLNAIINLVFSYAENTGKTALGQN